MKRIYKFAGVEVELSIPKPRMYKNERTLSDFRIETAVCPHRFEFTFTEKLKSPEGKLVASFPDYYVYSRDDVQTRYIGMVDFGWENAYIRAEHCGRQHHVEIKQHKCNTHITMKTVLNALSTEHLVLEANGVILHTSFINYKGEAILFTAPSGTGKSTQADLWAKYRGAEIINGDRAVIRLIDGEPFACGIPFAGSSNYCKNKTLPIKAIVCLKQAPVSTIIRLKPLEAFKHFWEECTVNTWNPEDVEKATSIVLEIALKVPSFQLSCTPDEVAVRVLEGALKRI